MAYDAASQRYTINADGRTQSFASNDIDLANSTSQLTIYKKVNGATTDTLTLTKPGTSGPETYKYVGAGFWQRTVDGSTTLSGRIDGFTYGVQTPDGSVPRSGNGIYAIDLNGAAAYDGGLYSMAGSGRLDIAFQSGDIILSGKSTLVNTNGGIPNYADFSGTGNLSGSGNAFDGTMNLGFPGTSTGTFNGRFYGPHADEVGATFTVSGLFDFQAVGTLIGRSAIVDDGQTLVTLNKPLTSRTTLASLDYNERTALDPFPGYIQTGSSYAAISGGSDGPLGIDPAAGTYSYNGQTFGAAQKVAAESTSAYTVYRVDAGGGRNYTLTVYKPGTGDGTLALNYLGYAQFRVGNESPGSLENAYTKQIILYGLITDPANMPRVGSATYSGTLAGIALAPSTTKSYTLGGTATFAANFGAGSMTGQLNPIYTRNGTAFTGDALTLDGAYIDASRAVVISGLKGPGGSIGNFIGQFYGPRVDEFGGSFRIVRLPGPEGDQLDVVGVAIAKKN